MQALEEAAHAANVEAGAFQQAETKAIGFAFEIARIVQLVLDRHSLPGHGRTHCEVGTAARGKDRHGQRQEARHLALARLVDQARHMVLGNMGDLVRQHRGKFRFGCCREDQSAMHSDVTAGHGKGIEGPVAQREELKILARLVALRGQTAAQPV